MKWIDLKSKKPAKGIRVLACDEFGYVSIESTDDVVNIHVGRMSWWRSWKYGNRTKIVAWMPLPAWPKSLCHETADGMMP